MSIPSHELFFEKISHYDRPQEPVTVGIPFPRGALSRAEQFALYDGAAEVYCQKSVTGSWDDGSIRWLLVHSLLDLPGGSGKAFRFAIEDETRAQPAPAAALKVVDGEQEVVLDTGPLQLAVGKPRADLIRSVTLRGERLWDEVSWPGFSVIDEQGTAFGTAGDDAARVEIEERGPLRVTLSITGRHRGGADGFLDYVIRIHAWAGKPYVALQYQFINREEQPRVAVREVHLKGRLSARDGSVRLTSGEGHYRTNKVVSEREVELGVDTAKMLRDASEHQDECFFGDFWVDWNGPRGGVTLTIRQAQQNFPKKLRATPDSLEAFLYPRGEHDLVLHQGVAKTHELLFHFHPPDLGVDEISRRSLQFQLPDHPVLASDWYREAGVWEDVFSGRRYGRLEALICDVIDTRPIGLGILSFGDEGTYGYTWQGRGDGKVVWLNGEYDIPHLMFLQYARTGARRFLETGRATAQHWVDVDFCHHSPDPLQRGGLMMHSADHVTAGVTVSHQWVEGFFDYYHLTGKREAWDAAIAIGENYLRHIQAEQYRQVGRYQARDLGWMLKALVALYRESGQTRFLEAGTGIVERFKEWQRSMGGFLAPYTDHAQIRVPFMIAIAVNALKVYHQATGDDSVKELILNEVDALLEHALLDNGLFYYKEFPSVQHPIFNGLALEALACAYRLSGDRDYILKGMRTLESILINMNFQLVVSPGGKKTVVDGGIFKETLPVPPGGQSYGTTIGPLIHFLVAADELDLLRPFDFVY